MQFMKKLARQAGHCFFSVYTSLIIIIIIVINYNIYKSFDLTSISFINDFYDVLTMTYVKRTLAIWGAAFALSAGIFAVSAYQRLQEDNQSYARAHMTPTPSAQKEYSLADKLK